MSEREFILKLAQRLYLAAEVLSIVAEKKKPRVSSAMEIRRRMVWGTRCIYR